MPSIERFRLVNSGTESTMTALRLARAYTKKQKILKFEGCYHGHHDALLAKSGSGIATLGIPDSAGVPPALVESTLTLPFNDIEKVKSLFQREGDQIAAIIIEPIAGNMNCIPARKEFLNVLRELADAYASILIFDEVITGFRVALGGAQSLYNIKPDLTALGKIIGGGLPIGGVGGKKEIMDLLAPLGPVYQAGTLSGNPISVAAGLATLQALQKPDVYSQLENLTKTLMQGFEKISKEKGISLKTRHIGSMFGLFFTEEVGLPNNYEEVKKGNLKLFQTFYHYMLEEGIYFAPSMYEVGFVSLAHTENNIKTTLEKFKKI